MGIFFLVELAIAITVLILSSQAKEGLQNILKDEAITGYRDGNINTENLIDWFQETVSAFYYRICYSWREGR